MMKTLNRCLVTTLFFLLTQSLAFADQTKNVTVSAAASLKNAFEEIGKLYESKHGGKCTFNFGASGDLARQISGGAPVDVFASAAQKDMDTVDKTEKLVADGTRQDFASNSVVLVVPAESKITITSFKDLGTNADVKKIAVGNPKTVPAGRYAEEVFTSLELVDSCKDKFVYAENVRQVLDYVARGEVDAGVVYSTDASVSKNVKVVAGAPDKSHKPIVYPIATIKGKNEANANAFIALVASPEGKAILQKYGFK